MKKPKLRLGFLAFLVVLGVSTGGAALAQSVKLTPFRSAVTIDFQNERGSQTRSVRLDMSESATSTPSAVVLGDFISTTGAFVEPASDVTTKLETDSVTQTIRLDIIVTPSISEWKAGEFSSSIRVAGNGFESATIPVTLTFRSGSPVRGGGVALIVLAVGVAVGLLFKSRDKPQPTIASLDASVGRKRVIRWATVLTGALTAAVIVLYGLDAQYLNNYTFGAGGFSDWLSLFAWGFAAGFAGKTISNFTVATTTPK